MTGHRSQPVASVDLPALYPVQERIDSESARFNVMNIGRRAGKTYFGVYKALKAGSSGKKVGWFSPTYKYMVEAWRDLARPAHDVANINNTERRIEFANGGVIEAWTLTDPDAGRSRKYHLAIIDEAAKARHLKTAWEQAIRATLTDYKGDAWFLSTPQGLNYFHDLYQRGQDDIGYPEWRSWQLPTAVNPFIDPAEIEAARLELPALVFKQEFLAEFIAGDGQVFRNIDRCMGAEETTPEAHLGHLLVAGGDWGRSHDFTALSIVCCHCQAEVLLDRFNKVGWEFQRDRIMASLVKWNVRRSRFETNSIGSPNLEAMHRAAPAGIAIGGFETTVKSKGPLIEALALALEQEQIQWLPDPVARHELIAYEATITESGYTKYSAPEGGFDDTVIARALAKSLARPIPKTMEERIDDALPKGWKSADIAALAPVEAQRRNDARQEDLKAIRERMINGRRPATQASHICDEGSSDDI